MQTYQFTLKANQRPETLERILRVIRHRGFYVVALQVQTENNIAHCDFTVKSERTLSLLVNQLSKMYDVSAINLVQA
ncbi:acetolactate synthase 2 small subunit [Pasteurella oralis]|uniref:Acetolactate synthase 2 small subunit n=1 Tax=Pasteurella oralis TaxID=1071947 RepID=A0ABW4NVM0_9PAST|nr:acetolactate synthase 2 small subunit [Pasteurella oralis]MDO5054361.1 acetolactate synthase 2 small subunit [Pasteurella oralis]